MKLDRELIKSQAKQLIKGRVLVLFAIVFVVSLLTNGANVIVNISNSLNNPSLNSLPKSFNYNIDGIDGLGDLEDYIDSYEDSQKSDESTGSKIQKVLTDGVLSVMRIVNLICMPLEIMLCGLFLMLIRGKAFSFYDNFAFVFKNTFNKDYFDKFLLMILRAIFTFLWALLFLIPGIIYYYKASLAAYIKADYPDLTWKDCLELSKKMTNNHKGELFVLDLSFIPWALLTGITLGLAGIYVAPYYQTTKALFYENFKQRAIATGEMNEYDFMTEAQKYSAFVNNNANANQNPYYQSAQPAVSAPYPVQNAAPAQTTYYSPTPVDEQFAAPQPTPAEYYAAPQSEQTFRAETAAEDISAPQPEIITPATESADEINIETNTDETL